MTGDRADLTSSSTRKARALSLHRRALRLERGRKLDDALTCQRQAVGAAPRMSLMHLELGRLLLRRGDFRAGLSEFETHWRLKGRFNGLPRFHIPLWDGTPLRRGRILLIADQGAGDAIQFVRYVPMVARLCNEVVLASPPALASLFARAKGVTRIVTRYEDARSNDVFCPLSRLPFVLGTTLETVPADVPYLAVESKTRAGWKARLDSKIPAGTLRVGIASAGNPTHPQDGRRSTRFAEWRPVLDAPGIGLVSLQKAIPARDRRHFASEDRVIGLGTALSDFADTAALVQNLDLVISVDTGVAHLAGALGRPVWLLLPWVPDWRWLLDRDDSPWYPTMRLFRQDEPECWQGVMRRIAAALTAFSTD